MERNLSRILDSAIPYLRDNSKETFLQKLKKVPDYQDELSKQYSENTYWRELAEQKGVEFLVDYVKSNESHDNEVELAIIGIERVPVIRVREFGRPYCRRGA